MIIKHARHKLSRESPLFNLLMQEGLHLEASWLIRELIVKKPVASPFKNSHHPLLHFLEKCWYTGLVHFHVSMPKWFQIKYIQHFYLLANYTFFILTSGRRKCFFSWHVTVSRSFYGKLGYQLDLDIPFATGIDVLWFHSKTSGALQVLCICI